MYLVAVLQSLPPVGCQEALANSEGKKINRDEKKHTCILREAYRKINSRNLLLEQILLVQEEDHRGVGKPLVVAYLFEEFQGFLHPVGHVVFVQLQVIFAKSNAKYDRLHVLKAMHPLFAFAPLSPHINHPKVNLVDVKLGFYNTGRLGTRPENILFVRNEV